MDEKAREPWTQKAAELKRVRQEEVQKYKDEHPKTKRPPSSYLLYSMQERPNILKDNPDMKIGEISKLCGQRWKDMTDEEKKPWMDQAKALKEEKAV